MTNSLDRRLVRLEGPPASGPRPIALMPERKTMEEWIEQYCQGARKGHYVLGPMPAIGNVRYMRWVPDQERSDEQ